MWAVSNRFQNFIPSISGMHWIMSFVGTIGVLMKNSGLLPWLKSAFGGVEKMITGKKVPMNVRELRFGMLELLRNHVKEMEIFEDFDIFLESCSFKSVLSKQCIVNFIRPVMLMLIYIRAKRERDFALQMYTSHKMMPYFFAASQRNYVQYGLCYLLTMHNLPGNILDVFMKGEHAMRHQDGL